MSLRKSISILFVVILLGSLGYYIWDTQRIHSSTTNCDLLHQSQNMALLREPIRTDEPAISVIADIYAVDTAIVKPTRFVGVPETSYVWNDGVTQHSLRLDKTSVISIDTGWNEPVFMQIAELFNCLGTPDFYSTLSYTMTPGFFATSLIYNDPDIRVVISFPENENIKIESTAVQINYLRNTRESELEEFMQYAYDVREPALIEKFLAELHPWESDTP